MACLDIVVFLLVLMLIVHNKKTLAWQVDGKGGVTIPWTTSIPTAWKHAQHVAGWSVDAPETPPKKKRRS